MSKTFAEELRNLRNKNGFSQQQVADMLGLTNKSTVGSWEIGKGSPDPATLVKLCFIYQVDFDHFAKECGIDVMRFGKEEPATTNSDGLSEMKKAFIDEVISLGDDEVQRAHDIVKYVLSEREKKTP